jgi:ribonuclease HII
LDAIELVDWRNYSPHPIVGVDEVGRGCLAGPVVAAAVSFPKDYPLKTEFTDSKKLSEARRTVLAKDIQERFCFGIGIASVEEIDAINILQASFLAMRRALVNWKEMILKNKMDQKIEENESVDKEYGHVLVDGHLKIPGYAGLQSCLVKGDLRAQPISAASIVAKVYRDQWMQQLHREYPQYGFDSNKGYGSEAHRVQISRTGPCIHHRKTFAGVKEFLHRLEKNPEQAI